MGVLLILIRFSYDGCPVNSALLIRLSSYDGCPINSLVDFAGVSIYVLLIRSVNSLYILQNVIVATKSFWFRQKRVHHGIEVI
jgi:hypothetical protein